MMGIASLHPSELKARHKAVREGYCYQHVQDIIVSTSYAEAATDVLLRGYLHEDVDARHKAVLTSR